jgi:hypothetical protein
LGEREAIVGLDSQMSAIDFNSDNATEAKCEDFNVAMNAMENLTSLDVRAQRGGCGEPCGDISVRIADQLDHMGLNHTMRQFLVGAQASIGIGTSGVAYNQQEKSSLQELWFRDAWRQLQWDDASASLAAVSNGHTAMQQPDVTRMCHDGTGWGFHECLDGAFRCLRSDDVGGCKDFVARARSVVLEKMENSVGEESAHLSLTPFVSKFHLLNDLVSAAHMLEGGHATDTNYLVKLAEVQDSSEIYTDFRVEDWEMQFSAREVVLRTFQSKASALPSTFDPNRVLLRHLQTFCATALKAGHAGIAEACIARWSDLMVGPQIADLPANTNTHSCQLSSLEIKFAKAKVMHLQNDFSGAIRTAKLVLGQLERGKQMAAQEASVETNRLIADVMHTCGIWISKHRIESAKAVLNNYLKPASALTKQVYSQSVLNSDLLRAVGAHLNMADFVSNIYEGVHKRVSSPEWKQAGFAAKERMHELEKSKEMYNEAREKYQKAATKKGGGKLRKSGDGSLAAHESTCHDLLIHLKVLEREVEMDKRERSAVEKSLADFLALALESFESGLTLSGTKMTRTDDSTIKHVFRLSSLWFSNQGSSDVNRRLLSISEKVPSYRFIPLTYQIFSRLDQESPGGDMGVTFQETLRALVAKMCVEHPYHSLVQLIALSNGNKVGTGVGGRQSSAYLDNVGDTKVQASTSVLDAVQRDAPDYVSSLIEAYKGLTDSYIHLAMSSTDLFQSQGRIRTKDIPMSMAYPDKARDKIVSLERVLGNAKRKTFLVQPCVLTQPPAIRPMGDYGGAAADPIGSERIEAFQSTFDLTETGLHRPKIVICVGSKGTKFKQLVKGEDDIRQDAIMEQVFTTVNRMLRTSSGKPSEASSGHKSRPILHHHELKIATYNIVPLSPASGVLEWVDNTIPFGEYLVDKPRTKTRKGAVGAHSRYYPGEWSSNLCRTHLKNAPASIKREAYDEVCKQFSPAFRFFFLEKFSESSQAWHAAKMRYTRSCAVSSIVGHILGIGDRHCHNILIHEKTGEVVHIDFGIVFDQGKVR